MDNEKKERDITEEEMIEHLNKIADSEGIFENPSTVIRFLAKMLYNYRIDFEVLVRSLKDVIESMVDIGGKEQIPKKKSDYEEMFR